MIERFIPRGSIASIIEKMGFVAVDIAGKVKDKSTVLIEVRDESLESLGHNLSSVQQMQADEEFLITVLGVLRNTHSDLPVELVPLVTEIMAISHAYLSARDTSHTQPPEQEAQDDRPGFYL